VPSKEESVGTHRGEGARMGRRGRLGTAAPTVMREAAGGASERKRRRDEKIGRWYPFKWCGGEEAKEGGGPAVRMP
jgi:hypothetical protein